VQEAVEPDSGVAECGQARDDEQIGAGQRCGTEQIPQQRQIQRGQLQSERGGDSDQ
jgi:hypothetical protein